MRIEISKESDSDEIVIWDADHDLALRVTLGADGIERVVHDDDRTAAELSADIAAAVRALGSTLEHILSGNVRDISLDM